MDRDERPLHRPIPRRPYETTPFTNQQNGTSLPPANRTLDFAAQLEAKLQESRSGASTTQTYDSNNADANTNGSANSTPARNRSVLNLTSSTLLGIYAPTERRSSNADGDNSEPQTPWGTGAETPSIGGREYNFSGLRPIDENRPGSPRGKQALQSPSLLAQSLRVLALFVFGAVFGIIIQHLQDDPNVDVAPVKLERLVWNHEGDAWGVVPWQLVFWGVASVVWGLALPWLDSMWERRFPAKNGIVEGRKGGKESAGKGAKEEKGKEGMEFLQLARIIGGFIGIAFAARKLVWKSTLQASLALSLVNPALWYLFDRTRSGFTLSLIFGLMGTCVLLLINPDMVPGPHMAADNDSAKASSSFNTSSGSAANEGDLIAGLLSYESVGMATWIGSVLFCSGICFGNIGRRLSAWVKGE